MSIKESPGASTEDDDTDPAAVTRARRWGRWIGGAIGVAVALAIVLAISLTSSQSDGIPLALAGTELAPAAAATGEAVNTPSGASIRLDVRGLEPAPPGFYYQAWVRNDDDGVTIGTFHLRQGGDNIALWSGVDLEDHPIVTVTIQQEGAGADSSGQVVLKGTIRPDG